MQSPDPQAYSLAERSPDNGLDTTNPPWNETLVAEYLKHVADAEGIPCELIGADPKRLNLVARLKGKAKAGLFFSWPTATLFPPIAANGVWSHLPPESRMVWYLDRALKTSSRSFAELAVIVEFQRSKTRLDRDVILLAEAGSTGITWLVQNTWTKIDAEFALNEFGFWQDQPSGERVFQIQTAEKVPTRVILKAQGTAGHGSLPRPG